MKIKNKIFLIIILICCIFLYKSFMFLFINEHNIDYVIKTEDNNYKVNEKFNKNRSLYTFLITNEKNKKYYFSIEKDLNKESKLIDDIKYFQSNKVKCILPIFKNSIDTKLLCEENSKLVSYSYLIQNQSKDLEKIEKKIKEFGYSIDFKNSDKYKKKGNSKIYYDNVLSDYTFTIWKYKGLDIINSEGISSSEKLFKEDKYENELAILVDDYYVYFDTNSNFYKNIYYYDIEDMKKYSYDIEDYQLDDIYINGIYESCVYITDVDNKKQYMFNLKDEKFEEVGNKTKGFYFYDGNELVIINYDKFFKNEMLFGYVNNKKLNKKYGIDNIFVSDNFYYFSNEEKFYRGYLGEEGREEILFSFDNLTEWKVIGRDVIFIVDDILYFYNEDVGIKKIYKDNELAYNFENICDFKRD